MQPEPLLSPRRAARQLGRLRAVRCCAERAELWKWLPKPPRPTPPGRPQQPCSLDITTALVAASRPARTAGVQTPGRPGTACSMPADLRSGEPGPRRAGSLGQSRPLQRKALKGALALSCSFIAMPFARPRVPLAEPPSSRAGPCFAETRGSAAACKSAQSSSNQRRATGSGTERPAATAPCASPPT